LALTNSALALWAVDLISRRFVSGDKRAIVLLLLMLLPAYQFYGQRFNANAVLLSTWPIATWCFLRSFETRMAGWAVAAGATAALAMLGKYYSVFLIGSFLFAAICHPQRRAYFSSSAPWISIAAGLVVLGPHLHWLAVTGAMPFSYALTEHGGRAFGTAALEALGFLAGLAAASTIPIVTWLLVAGRRLNRLPKDFGAMNPGLLLLFFIGIGTVVFPAITAVALGTGLPAIWGLSGLFLFVVVVVCGANYPIERFYAVNLVVMVIGIALFATIVVAPIHALYHNTHPLGEERNFYRKSAIELTRLWHAQSDIALPAVGGDEGLAFATGFYSPDHPPLDVCLVDQRTRQLPLAAFKRGWAALCFDGDSDCIASMKRVAEAAPKMIDSEFVVQSTLLGRPGATQRVIALIVPPSGEGRIGPASTVPVPGGIPSRCGR
jgi:hypothetical protein